MERGSDVFVSILVAVAHAAAVVAAAVAEVTGGRHVTRGKKLKTALTIFCNFRQA